MFVFIHLFFWSYISILLIRYKYCFNSYIIHALILFGKYANYIQVLFIRNYLDL